MKEIKCNREWIRQAIQTIQSDTNRSADTHLIKLDLPKLQGVDLYLKDESTHPTGSLKHRLARSLFLHAICNGSITKDTAVIEASSGSTAISEAYFARLLNLRFIAVMTKTTAKEKIALIEHYGGECHLVDKPSEIYAASQRLAEELNGHYMDQFTYAEQATDWRGNNNIAESIFKQMSSEKHPIPTWIVVGAGTGGTSATLGRYIRYQPELACKTKLMVADPENSVFFPYYKTRDKSLTSQIGSRIEGIGRPRVEPSFIANVVDAMNQVPDAASFATAHWLKDLLGKKCGPSTGTNLYTSLLLAKQMIENGQEGSIVSLICDSGERYLDTCYNASWLESNHLDIAPYITELSEYLD